MSKFGQRFIAKDYEHLPPELWPKVIRAGLDIRRPDLKVEKEGPDRFTPPPYTGEAIYLSRDLSGRKVTVGTTPTLLVSSSFAGTYMILNPSTSVGLTTTVTGFSGTANNNDVTPSIGVAGFDSVHLHLKVTALTGGTWDIIAQSYDSVSATWIDTQVVFSNIGAPATFYSMMGSNGVATDLRFKYVLVSGSGTITNSLAVVLKGGLGGSLVGLSNVVYLGNSNVNIETGFPLLEGHLRTFIIGPNVDLYGIAETNIDIRIFRL